MGSRGQVGAVEVERRGPGFLLHGAHRLRHLSPGSRRHHAWVCPGPLASEERSGWRCGLPARNYNLGKLRPRKGKGSPGAPLFWQRLTPTLSVPPTPSLEAAPSAFHEFAPSAKAEAGKLGEQHWAWE